MWVGKTGGQPYCSISALSLLAAACGEEGRMYRWRVRGQNVDVDKGGREGGREGGRPYLDGHPRAVEAKGEESILTQKTMKAHSKLLQKEKRGRENEKYTCE